MSQQDLLVSAAMLGLFVVSVLTRKPAAAPRDKAAYNIKTKAIITKKGPYGVAVEEGKTYYYCTCGASKNQPFCDGSHKAFNEENKTNLTPLKYVADKTDTVYFCGCRHSKTSPLCDGSHKQLA